MHKKYSNWWWTALTAYCYGRNMICKDCPEFNNCQMGEDARMHRQKLYGLKNVKEAVIMTYARVGKKGLSRFLGKDEEL